VAVPFATICGVAEEGGGPPATPLIAAGAAVYYAGTLKTFKTVYSMQLHCASDSPLAALLMCQPLYKP
jgi:hypothetical protein